MASPAADPLSLAGKEPWCCSTWEMFCWTVPQFQEGTLLGLPCCQNPSSPAEGHPFLWVCRSRVVTALLQAAFTPWFCAFFVCPGSSEGSCCSPCCHIWWLRSHRLHGDCWGWKGPWLSLPVPLGFASHVNQTKPPANHLSLLPSFPHPGQ